MKALEDAVVEVPDLDGAQQLLAVLDNPPPDPDPPPDGEVGEVPEPSEEEELEEEGEELEEEEKKPCHNAFCLLCKPNLIFIGGL